MMGVLVRSAPDVLINLTATDFSALSDGTQIGSWQNSGGLLGGVFVPAGSGEGIVYNTDVGGVPAVSFVTRNINSVMTNGVAPGVVCGTAPWSLEVWIYKPQIFGNDETVFTWTTRAGAANGNSMELRYGSNAGNAVEHFGTDFNLPWGGAVPAVGQWHHVVVTRDADGWERLYLNGALRVYARRTNINITQRVNFFTLGAVQNGAGTNYDMPFGGSVARLTLYNGPLTATQVFDTYAAERAAFNSTQEVLSQAFWNGTPNAWAAWDIASNWRWNRMPADNGTVYIDNTGKAEGFSGTNTFQNLFAINGGLSITGGLLTVSAPTAGTTLDFGGQPSSVFDFVLSGGKLDLPGTGTRNLALGNNGGSATSIIGGGDELAWLCVDRDLYVGHAPGSVSYMEVLANGLVTVSNGWFYAGAAGATSEVVVDGGTIRSERTGRVVVGQGTGAKAKLFVESGSVETADDLFLSDNNPNATNRAEVFLNGGLIWVRRIIAGGNNSTNIFYFNGGTLRNRDGRVDFMQGLTAAYIQSGGACFDILPNTTLDINQPLTEDPSDPGGTITKLGAGTLVLRGANVFSTSDITVASGNLLFRGANTFPSSYSGSILLQDGAGIGWEVGGGATALLNHIHPASEGAIILFGANAADSLNFTGRPNLSLGMFGTVNYTGTYTPHAGVHRFTVFGGANEYRVRVTGSDSIIIEAPSTGSLDVYGDNDYTGDTLIYGGRFVLYHENALGSRSPHGTPDIGIYNGAALMLNIDITQNVIDDIISRIKPDSDGALIVGNHLINRNYDLTGLPGIRLGADSGRDHNGTLTPDPTAGGYRLGGGRQGWNANGGLRHRNLTDDLITGTPRKVIVDLPGTAELARDNLFSGGIIVTNKTALWFQNDTALGAVPPGFVPDYLYVNDAALRLSPNITNLTTHPNRGFRVGDDGATLYTPNNRFCAWLGDLSGTGAITNAELGVLMFGGTNNTWAGTLTLNNDNNSGTFAVGYGDAFSWVKTNVIQGNGMFGVATDLDITWTDQFERPLGNVPPQLAAPTGTGANVGLRKLGSGTLTLDAANTYRRETRICAGTLKIGIANALPWGADRSGLNFINNNIFPLGTLDLNGFNVNINGLNGAGTILDTSPTPGATLTLGHANHDGRFWGRLDAPAKAAKTGTGTQAFWKGADVNALAVEQGTVRIGAETLFGNVALSGTSLFSVGLAAADIHGLTGEYFWFHFPELEHLVTPLPLVDLDLFESLLAGYAATHVQSSFSFGTGFDAGFSDTAQGHPPAPGSRFQGDFHNRSFHYARWTGEFYAETSGDYTFATASDDGSCVYINRLPAITNSYSQGYSYTTNSLGVPSISSLRYGEPMHLEQGWHDIVIGHYQGSGGRGLTVFMVPPGTPLPSEGLPPVLPQALLRPYPAKIAALSGTPASRLEMYGNMTLEVNGDTHTPDPFAGRLIATAPDTRLIKHGDGSLTLASQTTPEFNGQVTVTGGALKLQGATPFLNPLHVAPGGALVIEPEYAGWQNLGLKGLYYPDEYRGASDHFNNRAIQYVASTTQTGMLAVASSPTFWYQNGYFFPGPYAQIGDTPRTHFSIRFLGKFLALEPGDYTFGMQSDDRLDMFINGVQIIDNLTAGQAERLVTLSLAAGTHDVDIRYGQAGGGYDIRPTIKAPYDLVKQNMPNAYLRPSVSTVYGVNGYGSVALTTPGSYLRMDIHTPQALEAQISGVPDAQIEKNGADELTLVMDNDTFGGTWYLLQGTLIAGDGNTSGTLGGTHIHVAEGTQLIFDRTDDITYTGLITGNGEIISRGGNVTLTNVDPSFGGVFASGSFTISGANNHVQVNALIQQDGKDPATVRFQNGANVLFPTDAGTLPPLAKLIIADATLVLPPVDNAAYYIGALTVEAGTSLNISKDAFSGLYGYYYDLDDLFNAGTDAQAQTVLDSNLQNLATAEAFLATCPFIEKVITWAAGNTLDFGENGANFPASVRTKLPGPGHRFAAIWKGKIVITEPGEYTFTTRSDDGSFLFINGERVVDNRGSHGMQDRSGTVLLQPGLHDFALTYQQGTGGYGLRVSIRLPGQETPDYIPNAMFIPHPADTDSGTLALIPPEIAAARTSFTLEVGTLGVINGPGTGTVNLTGSEGALTGTLLLNDLYIEALGAVLATVGKTELAGTHLHATMGSEPPRGTLTKIADFTQAPHGLLLLGKTTSIDGAENGRLIYKPDACLYVSVIGGTVIILR